MNGKEMLYAMNYVNQMYVEEAAWEPRAGGKRSPYIHYFTAAACLCLALLGIFRLGADPGGVKPPVGPVVVPPVESGEPAATIDPLQPPTPQKVTIQWNFVAVNESEGLAPDYALRYYDPNLYAQETWGEEEIISYYGWNLAPAYIPEGLTGGGWGVSAGIYREKATGEIVQEQAGRGFWSGFWEDGSPKSDDDLYIPTGFTVRASKKVILHCGLLPTDDERVTDFDTVPVTLSHCSMKHGPFDPTQKAPDGLSNMPAGYYDIYVATFELDGVKYEVEAQRLELEEVIKIVASIIKPYEDITVGVGCGMP